MNRALKRASTRTQAPPAKAKRSAAAAREAEQQKPAHRIPYYDELPQTRMLTVQQAEAEHPALKGRLRAWIHHADARDPEYVGLQRAIVRVARSVLVNERALLEFFYQRTSMPPAPPRISRHRAAMKQSQAADTDEEASG